MLAFRNLCSPVAGIVIGCSCFLGAGWAADSLRKTEPEPAALVQQLKPVPPHLVPPVGTFWLLAKDDPPWPFLPPVAVDFGLPVYAVEGEGSFVVDDRSVDYAALARLEAELEAAELVLGLRPPVHNGPARDGRPIPQRTAGGGVAAASSSSPGEALWLELLTATHQAVTLVVHTPTPERVYDLFGTTNLNPAVPGFNLTNWFWVLRTQPGQTNLTVTNLYAAECYFRLAGTNDSDGGGFSDAFECLVTHTDPNDPADDRLTPLVGIQVLDSVAIEQYPTHTARFRLSRLGGYVSWPLDVHCGLSGTATYAVDYSLAPATLIGTNVTVTFQPGQTTVELILTPVPDSQTEGSEIATLSVLGGAGYGYEVDSAHASATGWILEQYQYTYTTVADFRRGTMMGLEAAQGGGDGQLQFTSNLPPQFPFIAVACSGRGTIVRINTTNGAVIGEYRTAPSRTGESVGYANPSRTTVDLFGNVWVANRADVLNIGGTNYGSITRIGLIMGGTRFSKSNGVYYPDPTGQYVAISNAVYNTCIDRDGDGFIRTSRGLADILAWDNPNDVDTYGGVSTAEDEAILEYVRVPTAGTRAIAVDRFNDIWVGGTHTRHHVKANGLTGSIVPGSVFDPQAGGYGAVIDRWGRLWSTSPDAGVLRFTPPALMPPTTNDWVVLSAPAPMPYGIAVDPRHGYIWQTSYQSSNVFRWWPDGTYATNADSSPQLFNCGAYAPKGLVVDTNGHVWVAHSGGTTVGHLDTNGIHIGNVQMRLTGLRAEYFPNTNFAGTPGLVRIEAPLDFDWGQGSPAPSLPSNHFSARWLGVLEPRTEGEHVLIVSADAGAAVRLTLEGQVVSSNWWEEPGPYPVVLYLTNYLSTNTAYALKLEYIEFTGEARVRLSWIEPGQAAPVVIPRDRFVQTGQYPHGVSVDAAGKIWAANLGSDNVMRIDPTAGPIVVTTNAGVLVTNYVGQVDMVVDLGDGSYHPAPYTNAAAPYNYSDMTGFNNRIVNPTLQPFKGYWIMIHDSGIPGLWWDRISWNASVPEGCDIEVFVRASDERPALARQAFVQVTNNAMLQAVHGRYIEVRVALIRDDPAKKPALHDLTLHARATSFLGGWLDDTWAYETEDAQFHAQVLAPEPIAYRWYILYPWTNQFAELPAVTGPTLTLTNVDLWDDWTMVSVLVSNAVGETLWLGPATLSVYPLAISIPGSGTMGPASRYPATIHVRGMPTNLASVRVILYDLRHTRPDDLDILLVSPSGKKIMLMSDAGGNTAVTNATLVFDQSYWFPPDEDPLLSWERNYYCPANYGTPVETQLPGAPPGQYSTNLFDLVGDNPNGLWQLYIYDDSQQNIGVLLGSWWLEFTFQ